MYFPAIRAAAEAGDWKDVEARIRQTSDRLRNAAEILLQDPATMIDE